MSREGTAGNGALALAAVAGILGAAGVSLAAVAAHKIDSPSLVTAANMLMIHAGAGVAIAAMAARASSPVWTWTGALMLAAVALFSGDVAVHAITGNHIFPYAAPAGGTLTIVSWIAVSLAALHGIWRGA